MTDPLVGTDDELGSKASSLHAEDMDDPVEESVSYSKSSVNWYPSEPSSDDDDDSEFQELISKQRGQIREEKTTSSSSSSTKRDRQARPTSSQITRPSQRQRRVLECPLDRNLLDKHIMDTLPVKIQELLQEDVETQLNLNRGHITVQILGIITPQGGPTGNAYTRFQRGNNGQQKINFIRILLCHSYGRPCYKMITNNLNRRLFSRDTMLRDNGTVTLGTYIRLLAPYPIQRNMQGIPLLQSMYPAIVMETPQYIPSIAINKYIQANQTGVGYLKSVTIEVRRTAPIQTTCSGKHCDKARQP